MFDLRILGGSLVDGSGGPALTADVGVRGDRITAVGDLGGAVADVSIDATNRVVAPGFIDAHSHSDGWLLKRPHLLAKTTQGFTTEIVMADGMSYAPVNEHTAIEWIHYLRALDGLEQADYDGWHSLAEFMGRIDGRNVQNAAAHLPYANVRSLVCGFGQATPDRSQTVAVQEAIHAGLGEGAVGLSTGLDYISQCFSTTDELVTACSVVAEHGALYVTHIRYKAGLIPALREAVDIGRRAGARVHVSHLKSQSERDTDQLLSFIDEVARHEVDFSFDVYPYQRGSTLLSSLVPDEMWSEGPQRLAARLRESDALERLREGLEASRFGLDDITIGWAAGSSRDQLAGMSLSRYVAERGSSPEVALRDLLLDEGLAVLAVLDDGDDEMVRPMLEHELCLLGTDGIYFDSGVVHPRVYGSVGRMLGEWSRSRPGFSIEEAVRKMSGFPAQRFGLKGRGLIREGAFADLVVFDPHTVGDPATYEDPHHLTVGVDDVVVNGTPILRDGEPIGTGTPRLPGRFVRRSGASPAGRAVGSRSPA